MDEIVFYCAKCDAKLSAGVEEAGMEFQCPKCEVLQIVPAIERPFEDVKKVTTRLTVANTVPPPPPPQGKSKKTIIISSTAATKSTEEEEYEELEDLNGGGLRMFAVALGTVGFVLCAFSLVWAVLSLQKSADTDWWLMLLIFTSTFLCGIMGLVLAQLARFVVRIGDRLDQLEYD